MLEQETMNALIEAKEQLEAANKFILDAQLVANQDVIIVSDLNNARAYVLHAFALIASILDRGR